MELDLMDLYRRGSGWTGDKVAGVKDLEGATPCSEWKLRDLLNHILDTQRYFARAGRGESAMPPGPNPPDTVSDTPADDFAQARSDVISVFSEEGVIEKTMPALGVAFTDALIHGWDVARATGQDAAMPTGSRRRRTPRSTAASPTSSARASSHPRCRWPTTQRRSSGCSPTPGASRTNCPHTADPGCASAHASRTAADRVWPRGNGTSGRQLGHAHRRQGGTGERAKRNAVRTQPHMPGRENRYAI